MLHRAIALLRASDVALIPYVVVSPRCCMSHDVVVSLSCCVGR
jgi:hypothetical protein